MIEMTGPRAPARPRPGHTPALLHRYTYTYDDADNMLTKAVYDPSGPSTVTTTFTYNDANEQVNMDDGTTSIDMTYDEWGRLIEKDDGTYTATYAYRYGGKLYSVTSDFPGEGNVTYETGGDGKRRSRVAGASETWYNYTVGFDVVSTEDDADGSTGALTMTNVVRTPVAAVSAILGDLAGATPATGDERYYANDRIGSTRSAWNASKVAVGTYEFTPYGGEYSHTGAALASLAGAYTGKPWDDSAKLFHFPFRQYSPLMARWTSRDPLGMADGPNVYGYVRSSPANRRDLMGLKSICEERCEAIRETDLAGREKIYKWESALCALFRAPQASYACQQVIDRINERAKEKIEEKYEKCVADCKNRPCDCGYTLVPTPQGPLCKYTGAALPPEGRPDWHLPGGHIDP